MLKFWKKSGHQRQKVTSNTPPNSTSTANRPPECLPDTSPLENGDISRCAPLSLFEDEGLFDIDEFESNRDRSRLSKTLEEILSDQAAQTYFLQFMESRSASPYVLCWTDIEAFKADASNRSLPKDTKTVSPVPSNRPEHDSLSVSTDCDSFTADSNSLCDLSIATVSECKIGVVATDDRFSEGKATDDKTNPLGVGVCDKDSSDISPKCNKNSLEVEVHNRKSSQYLIDNALVLFKKYIALEAVSSVKCPEDIRKQIIENLCDMDKVLGGVCFDEAQKYVYDLLEKEYFEAFLGSDYFCKYQIDVLTSGNVVLDDILYNETALFYFMEFLEQENNRSLLEFWIAATNFHQQLRHQKELMDPVEAQNDAVVLYDKYFSLQATCPLGFSDKVRFAVEQNICGENGLIHDCFHLPIKIVERVLGENHLKSFLSSQLYYKYLSDLINTIQSNGYLNNIEKRACSSDCGSERSFSTNSTFLAMEIPQNRAKKQEKKADMTIDTRELYDPDSLWKRRRHHKLICGRISDLGTYETGFEPEPDRKEFNFKRAVKKLVTMEDEERKKEEMALRVAEMIVRDITSVTLKDCKGFTL